VRLKPQTAAAGYRLHALGATQSTNDDALHAAREGDRGPLWVVAEEQLAGRGRQGRRWASPRGNLYASLLLTDPCEPSLAPQLGFVAGLALHGAVETVTGIGAPRLALKWPNDLLLDGAKVSGLLLEGHRIGATLAIVIGFGVNVTHAPRDTPYPAAALRSVAPSAAREALFEALAAAFCDAFAAWGAARHLGASDRFRPIRDRWLARAAGLGTKVALRLPAGERRGVFRGLDGSGRLQLETAAGTELIDAGDLYFPDGSPADAGPAAGTR
jgi:BirA family transcriptional regulator, biotin operon repressor / biotin---[acetyl-CoA-carboxylase] ligase